jgi:hypothetical protein
MAAGARFMRFVARLVGIVRCRNHVGRVQRNAAVDHLSRSIFVALLEYFHFRPVSWLARIHLAAENQTLIDLNRKARNRMANTIRALVFAILSLAFLASVSHAQQATSGTGGGQKRHQQKTDKSAAQTAPKADEKAYNAALKSLPNKPYDPWFGAR